MLAEQVGTKELYKTMGV